MSNQPRRRNPSHRMKCTECRSIAGIIYCYDCSAWQCSPRCAAAHDIDNHAPNWQRHYVTPVDPRQLVDDAENARSVKAKPAPPPESTPRPRLITARELRRNGLL